LSSFLPSPPASLAFFFLTPALFRIDNLLFLIFWFRPPSPFSQPRIQQSSKTADRVPTPSRFTLFFRERPPPPFFPHGPCRLCSFFLSLHSAFLSSLVPERNNWVGEDVPLIEAEPCKAPSCFFPEHPPDAHLVSPPPVLLLFLFSPLCRLQLLRRHVVQAISGIGTFYLIFN